MQYLLICLSILLLSNAENRSKTDFDSRVAAILQRIEAPRFPHTRLIVNVDSSANFQQHINRLVQQCHFQKGGTVVVPAGNYTCNGPIRMLSNVNLHLEKGATIHFGINPDDYLPLVKVRWEGTVCYNYSPLIYAIGQENIAITGKGVLNGQADRFWFAWKKQPDGKDQEAAKKILRSMGENGVPETERRFGNGFYLRPTLIEFFDCKNVLLEEFTAKQSPFWTIHPVFSSNITIRGLTIQHGTTNDDGIDPDSCSDVLIEDCKIDTHDDAIAIKSGRDQDAWSRPGTQGIVIRNNRVQSSTANAICVGSEMSGGVSNVLVDRCVIDRADNGFNIKANLDRGGYVRGFWARNISIDSCRESLIRIMMDYHGYRGGNHPPDFDDLRFEKITARAVRDQAWWLVGVPDKPIGKVMLKKVSVKKQTKENNVQWVSLENK